MLRHDWQLNEVLEVFELPLNDLIFQAQSLHRQHFPANQVQLSSLLNIKTGACSEDCSYCSQSKRYDTELEDEPLMNVDAVVAAAAEAQQNGAQRFCMGAAWRRPKPRDFDKLLGMVRGVKALGLETCMTLGMLDAQQAQDLHAAGLDYYNHNLDTSERFYPNIVTTHTYADRLDTLEHVREAGLKVCCGGIIGLGETREDRAAMLRTLANLSKHPDSVPINQLVKIPGTPLEEAEELDGLEMVRCIAVARILMPHSYVRLSAGRSGMTLELQALCFLAGANSIFYGATLLTTPNQSENADQQLMRQLGLEAATP
jgi:biotin synthase